MTTESSLSSLGKEAVQHGLKSDYAVIVVLPIVLTILWIAIWKFGGGKELVAAVVSMVNVIKESLGLAKEIAEIHERVVLRSPVEYREVIQARSKNPDHVPSPRARREGN